MTSSFGANLILQVELAEVRRDVVAIPKPPAEFLQFYEIRGEEWRRWIARDGSRTTTLLCSIDWEALTYEYLGCDCAGGDPCGCTARPGFEGNPWYGKNGKMYKFWKFLEWVAAWETEYGVRLAYEWWSRA